MPPALLRPKTELGRGPPSDHRDDVLLRMSSHHKVLGTSGLTSLTLALRGQEQITKQPNSQAVKGSVVNPTLVAGLTSPYLL